MLEAMEYSNAIGAKATGEPTRTRDDVDMGCGYVAI